MPYVYIEIQPLMKPKSITQSICRCLQVPYLPRESTEELTGRLQQLLPKMQTKAICIDDAHQVRAGKESSYVTDWFKHAVTALPTSFIFTGADMESSALLSSRASGGYVASDQIARRAERVTFARRPLTFDAKAPWTKDLRLVESTVRLPTGSSVGHMSSRAASEWLHNETGLLRRARRPGATWRPQRSPRASAWPRSSGSDRARPHDPARAAYPVARRTIERIRAQTGSVGRVHAPKHVEHPAEWRGKTLRSAGREPVRPGSDRPSTGALATIDRSYQR
jgi:hypothetical protein